MRRIVRGDESHAGVAQVAHAVEHDDRARRRDADGQRFAKLSLTSVAVKCAFDVTYWSIVGV